jgi:hypothetical protein
MSLFNIIKGILNVQKKIDVSSLPSQGLFYKDDFEIYIKKAELEDIIEYEHKYDKEDLGIVITRLKKIVEKNVILSKNFNYNDIKSIDVVFLFLEIVKFTNGKPVKLYFFNDKIGKEEEIKFEASTFNYAELESDILSKYVEDSKEFDFDGYKYSVPSIGVENSLTQFLISKSNESGSEVYNTYSYDFLYFLGHKSYLTFDEIENLIQIFNYDMEDSDKNRIRKIVKKLSIIGKYSLKKDSQIIDVTAKIDLGTIWK